MKIKLSPVQIDESLAASIDGDKITINGELFDFSQLMDGETLPRRAINSVWICSDVSRVDGEINLALMLPHGQFAPHETLFPAAYDTPISIKSGELQVPPYNAEEVHHD